VLHCSLCACTHPVGGELERVQGPRSVMEKKTRLGLPAYSDTSLDSDAWITDRTSLSRKWSCTPPSIKQYSTVVQTVPIQYSTAVLRVQPSKQCTLSYSGHNITRRDLCPSAVPACPSSTVTHPMRVDVLE